MSIGLSDEDVRALNAAAQVMIRVAEAIDDGGSHWCDLELQVDSGGNVMWTASNNSGPMPIGESSPCDA